MMRSFEDQNRHAARLGRRMIKWCSHPEPSPDWIGWLERHHPDAYQYRRGEHGCHAKPAAEM